MSFGAELPKPYWAQSVSTAVYLLNRSPSSSVNEKIPEELWNGIKPNLSHIRVFGCKAFRHREKRLK